MHARHEVDGMEGDDIFLTCGCDARNMHISTMCITDKLLADKKQSVAQTEPVLETLNIIYIMNIYTILLYTEINDYVYGNVIISCNIECQPNGD